MKIIKIAPAFGHNIEQFIRPMNTMGNINLHIIYFGKNNLGQHYKNVKFIKMLSINGLMAIYRMICGQYDLVWVQGGNMPVIPVAILRIINKILRKKTIWIYNVWGEKIILTMERKSIFSFFYKKALSSYDAIHLNWFTLKKRLQKKIPENKLYVFLWGLPECYFNSVNDMSKEMIENEIHLEDTSCNFFFPKSISSASGHLLLSKAVKLVSESCQDKKFKIYILEGNGRDNTVYKEFIQYINQNNLNSYFVFIEFKRYLNPSEMNYLWKHFDCGLQIVYRDQLSNTLVEPIASGLPVIASNLDQYSDFSDYFDLKIELTENVVEILSEALKLKILRKNNDYSILKVRADKIKKGYIFEENLKKIIDHYQMIVKSI